MILHNDINMANVERAISNLATQLNVSADEVRQNSYRDHLKFLKPLPASGGTVEFNPVSGNDTLLDTENKITNTDVVVVFAAGVTVAKIDGINPSNYAGFGTARHFTYPDGKFFVGTKAGEKSESEQLERIWNGILEFEKSDSVFSRLNLTRSRFVPISTYDTAPQDLQGWGATEGERGMANLYPQLILDGSIKNRVKLQIAPGAGTILDGSTDNVGAVQNVNRNFVEIWLEVLRYSKTGEAGKCDVSKVSPTV